jgi:gamma-glutamylcyclotransferase (GGCT)/AIG2-like uncharacterized protein YtfP
MKRLPFFVYGTLLSGQPNDVVWGSAVTSRRPARFLNGCLYDMGAFPMLVEGEGGLVYGQLVEVVHGEYESVLRRLDQLEQYDPRDAAAGPYRRELRYVLLDDGRIAESWVYLGYSHIAAQAPLVSSGDWRTHTEQWLDRLDGLWRQIRVSEHGLFKSLEGDPP